MDKEKAWRKFSKSGSVFDYIEFKNCVDNDSAEAKTNENDHRRPCDKGNGYGGK